MLNVIMLSNSSTQYLTALTQVAIESLRAAKAPSLKALSGIRIVLVETQKNIKYKNVDKQIEYDFSKYGKFNYNYALNLGIDYCRKSFSDNDWYCFSNNDVVYTANWLQEISFALQSFPSIESLCPNTCQLMHRKAVSFGYGMKSHLEGCCIMSSKRVVDDVLKSFDEKFSYYFQDDDYLEIIKRNNVKHAMVLSSIVHHIGSQTTPEDISSFPLLIAGRDVFVEKYGQDTYAMNEIQKRQYIKKLNAALDMALKSVC